MSLQFRFDQEKALEVLYITNKSGDTYTALKILYFADRTHLGRYGRLICGDSYIAMDKGPVPSGVYDLVKQVRNGKRDECNASASAAFTVIRNTIKSLRKANLDLLSESDIECLDETCNKYGHMTFRQFKTASHDSAYKAEDHNSIIPLEAILRSLPNGELVLAHINGC